ncbi:MAG TPA: murein biosynthesis integral membrane protein MurJ [Acidimicrobiales bacterium]|nr:murein biosynthesis integral membrane protein MurJ [Acidimicrobiales bacterium]
MTRPVAGSRTGQRRQRREGSTSTAPRDDSGRGASHVGAGILLSRLSGLLREVVTAGFLGLTGSADAFRAALRIPNLMQNLLGEGVLSASFIPVYSRLVDTDEEEAGRTAGAVAGLLVAATSVLVLVGMVLSRPLTLLLTPGFADEPAKLDLTVSLVRIMFPGVGLLVLSAWCLAILNSHRRFFLSYVAPVLWNAAQIVVVAVVAIGGSTPRSLANALAWGVVLGGFLQLAVQLPAVRTLVPHLRLSLDRNRRNVRDSLSRLGPVIFGRGVVQISGYVDLFLASLLASGALAADTQAQFLYLLPVSLFGMSIAAAELPELSRLGPQAPAQAKDRVERGLARVAYFVAPTAVLYVALGELLVAALFERGRFGPSDTRLVWLSLSAYALGLIATTASRLLQNTLYALDDPRTPARIALVRVVLGTLVALSLMFWFDGFVLVGTTVEAETAATATRDFLHLGVVGIAIGSATAAWCEFLLLRLALAWRIGRVTLGGGRLPVVLTAALVAAAAGRVVALVIGDPPALVAAVPVFGVAGAVYLLLTTWQGMRLRDELTGVSRS